MQPIKRAKLIKAQNQFEAARSSGWVAYVPAPEWVQVSLRNDDNILNQVYISGFCTAKGVYEMQFKSTL